MACADSKLGKIKEAYDALKLALDNGYKSYSQIEKDPDLKNLRADGGWKEWWAGAKKEEK